MLSPDNLGRHLVTTVIYVAYLFISIIPEFVYVADTTAHPENADTLVPALFTGFHMLFVVPVTTILCIAAVFVQAREVQSRPPGSPIPLSTVGLGLQAVIFTFVAVSWACAPSLYPMARTHRSTPADCRDLVRYGCQRTINDGIFAAGQALLLRLMLGDHDAQSSAESGGETEPLLGRPE
ncbi:hypothetical protein N658DRAFT_494246 [Parathielavia hyrcaniae]|uniref:Uncharacterized protein n=1 Tax=Parathielavia hyrcaniae TaxID=113614 RepID=A0AAN6T3H2_9PEZI|nr:hypothetical protein N658DRAFT_494246 [Parathielavia hyrcaniae]